MEQVHETEQGSFAWGPQAPFPAGCVSHPPLTGGRRWDRRISLVLILRGCVSLSQTQPL